MYAEDPQLSWFAPPTDEHRAMNYLTVRYPAIYHQAAQAHAYNQTLTSVGVELSLIHI